MKLPTKKGNQAEWEMIFANTNFKFFSDAKR